MTFIRTLAMAVLMAFVAAPQASYAQFPHNLQRMLQERNERVQELAQQLPSDNFGHNGWKRYIALKGDRRITFGGLRFTTNTGDVCVRFAAYKISTGEPFVTSYWQLYMGRNFDLAKRQAFGTFVMHDRPPVYKMRAWASKDDDVVFYLDGDPLSSGQPCM